MAKVEYEKCIICGKETKVPKDLNINLRSCYIEGMGQLCLSCFFNKKDKEGEY